MTAEERDELLSLFMAALQAVVPAVTKEQGALVQEVVAGMVRERSGAGAG